MSNSLRNFSEAKGELQMIMGNTIGDSRAGNPAWEHAYLNQSYTLGKCTPSTLVKGPGMAADVSLDPWVQLM